MNERLRAEKVIKDRKERLEREEMERIKREEQKRIQKEKGKGRRGKRRGWRGVWGFEAVGNDGFELSFGGLNFWVLKLLISEALGLSV